MSSKEANTQKSDETLLKVRSEEMVTVMLIGVSSCVVLAIGVLGYKLHKTVLEACAIADQFATDK